MNPYAKKQIQQYAESEAELFELMIKGEGKKFRQRLLEVKYFIFGGNDAPIMLDDKVMGEYSLGSGGRERKPNTQLSLFPMADAWKQLDINPYKNLICQTPPFRLRLGIVEYLFRQNDLFEESMEAALTDMSIRGDDLKFHTAVTEWTSIISHGDYDGYMEKFEDTKVFFRERIPEAMQKSNEMISRLGTARPE